MKHSITVDHHQVSASPRFSRGLALLLLIDVLLMVYVCLPKRGENAPGPAAAFALENLPAGRLLDDTLVSIVQRWTQMSPHEAATWVGRFPEGALRAAAIENLVTQWQGTDADSARKWREANLKPPTPAAQLERRRF